MPQRPNRPTRRLIPARGEPYSGVRFEDTQTRQFSKLLHPSTLPVETSSVREAGGAMISTLSSDVLIREARPCDYPAVREINRRAFGQEHVADLVDALRQRGRVALSLVAVAEGRPVGHALYCGLRVEGLDGAALGPLAALPAYQRRGIGSLLVRAGNARLLALGCRFIIVIGDPRFYARFGFERASQHGLACACPVPEATFMLLKPDGIRMSVVREAIGYRLGDYLIRKQA